ncbi:MAG: NAD(P)-dependent oxidoreductase, partial [Spirochaetota bacterium]|nr:NAD(P)-dependent oxidoreductase [Spirochaetota bacterium]
MFFADKTVLVTGATGLIGSNLVNTLLASGARVIAVSRKVYESCFDDKILCEKRSQLVCVQGDISSMSTDYFDTAGAKKIDYVFHAASPIAGEVIKTSPLSVIQPNIFGLMNLFDASVKHCQKPRFIIFSSATVYGNVISAGNGTESCAFCEEQTESAESLSGLNAPYSESKRMAEVIAQSYVRQFDCDAVIVRPSYVYGYTKNIPNTAFYQFIQNVLNNRDVVLKSTIFTKRDNIHIDDVISALLLIAQKARSGDVFNISSNNTLSNYASIDAIARIIVSSANSLGKKCRLIVPDNTVIQNGAILDNTRLKNLGWEMNQSLEDGILVC